MLVGVGRMEERFSVNALVLPLTAKTIQGCMYGSVNFKTDFPMYLDFYRNGQLDLDGMVKTAHAPWFYVDDPAGANLEGQPDWRRPSSRHRCRGEDRADCPHSRLTRKLGSAEPTAFARF